MYLLTQCTRTTIVSNGVHRYEVFSVSVDLVVSSTDRTPVWPYWCYLLSNLLTHTYNNSYTLSENIGQNEKT